MRRVSGHGRDWDDALPGGKHYQTSFSETRPGQGRERRMEGRNGKAPSK